MHKTFSECISKHQQNFHPIIKFDSKNEKIISLDFSKSNTTLTSTVYNNILFFSDYVSNQLINNNAKFGIGGYLELRDLYKRSELFNSNQSINEPRKLHLGLDIWGEANSPIFAFINSTVHSFANNNQMGDYGATIILQHKIESYNFYTLYGHLSLKNIKNLNMGKQIKKGECFAHFGESEENGYWPPHLHFQIILDLEGYRGDYTGVCALSDQEKYASNCPNPDLILQLNQFI